jgi:hypothetical protein
MKRWLHDLARRVRTSAWPLTAVCLVLLLCLPTLAAAVSPNPFGDDLGTAGDPIDGERKLPLIRGPGSGIHQQMDALPPAPTPRGPVVRLLVFSLWDALASGFYGSPVTIFLPSEWVAGDRDWR